MERFELSRKNMADLLVALKGEGCKTPLEVLQGVWARAHEKDVKEGKILPAFIATKMPPIFEKLLKGNKQEIGFSINEIVSLGNQLEYTHLSPAAVQNWVKRDVKELIGFPQIGKKYTIEQAAILFIVEDLKASLDFDSIRKMLTLVFNNPADRSDDIINPIYLYGAYATIFEKIHHQVWEAKPSKHQSLNERIEQEINDAASRHLEALQQINSKQKRIVLNVLVTASFAVQAAYYQALTKHFANATFFLQDLD